jgi:NAD(P)-dependent dehydrogenase (short-subunit alcohol dehydrogenase family)
MDLALTGKRVLITGGSKGIGLACAESFAEAGCDLILVSRDGAKLAEAADTLRGKAQVNVQTFAADLATDEGRAKLHTAHPDPDILVNNAGAIPGGRLADISMDRWRQAWDLKLLGYIHMCQLYLPGMEARKAGAICNIIGMAGRTPRMGYIAGCTANAALIAFTAALGGAAAASGVRVFGINPAATRTDRMMTLARTNAQQQFGDPGRWAETLTNLPFGRAIEPREIADLAAFLCSPRGGYVNGTVVDVDGGAMFRG